MWAFHLGWDFITLSHIIVLTLILVLVFQFMKRVLPYKFFQCTKLSFQYISLKCRIGTWKWWDFFSVSGLMLHWIVRRDDHVVTCTDTLQGLVTLTNFQNTQDFYWFKFFCLASCAITLQVQNNFLPRFKRLQLSKIKCLEVVLLSLECVTHSAGSKKYLRPMFHWMIRKAPSIHKGKIILNVEILLQSFRKL